MFSYDEKTKQFHHKETVPAAGTSDPLYLVPMDEKTKQFHHPVDMPRKFKIATSGAGTPTVDYTISASADIDGGTAVWHTIDTAEPVTLEGASAVRCAAAVGDVVFEVTTI